MGLEMVEITMEVEDPTHAGLAINGSLILFQLPLITITTPIG